MKPFVRLIACVLLAVVLLAGGCDREAALSPLSTVQELQEGESAVLIYFHDPYDDLCVQQEKVLAAVERRYRGVVSVKRVPALVVNSSDNAALLIHFQVHNLPTFILKKRGECRYNRAIDFHNQARLEEWIDWCMKNPAR